MWKIPFLILLLLELTGSLIPDWFYSPFSWISGVLRGIHPSAIDHHSLWWPLMPAFASKFLAEPRGGGSEREGGSQSCLRQRCLWAATSSVLSLTEKQNGNYSGAWTKVEASQRPLAEVYRCQFLCFLGEWVTVAMLKSLKCLLSIHNSMFSLFVWLLSNIDQAFANRWEPRFDHEAV